MITVQKTVKVLTPTEAIAADAAGVLKAGLKHRIPFTAEDGNDYSVDFYPSKLGKFPGTAKLNHRNGEQYEVKCALMVTGGIYPADTVEVYRCEDHRGNVFTNDAEYIAGEAYNSIWYFWWGDDKVVGNTLTNSSAETSTGNAPDSFQGNVLHHSEWYAVNDTWVAPDPVIGLKSIIVENCYLYAGASISLQPDSHYDVSFTYNIQMIDCHLVGGSFTAVTTGVILNGWRNNGGTSGGIQVNGCALSVSNFTTGGAWSLACTGTGAAAEQVTVNNSVLEAALVVMNPPVGGARTHANLDIQGWVVSLSPDHNETDLKLSRTLDAGVYIYDSNLAVFKDCANLADLDADGYIVMTGTRDKYAGLVALGGLGSTSGAATAINGVKRETRPLDYRSLRLVAFTDSVGSVPAYAKIFHAPSNTLVPDWEVMGQTVEFKHVVALNPSETIRLLLRTKGNAGYCVMTDVTEFH